MSTSVAYPQLPAIQGTVLFGYRVGREFNIEGHPYRLSRTLSKTEALLERLDELMPRKITKSEFQELMRLGQVNGVSGLSRGNPKFHIEPPSGKDLEIANWRLGYVKAFLALPKQERKARLVHQLRDQEARARAANNDNVLPPLTPPHTSSLKPPSIATIYRWAQRYEPDTGPLSLLAKHFRSGRKSTPYCAAVENIFREEIQAMIDSNNLSRADAVVKIRARLNTLAQEDATYANSNKMSVSSIYRHLRLYGEEYHTALMLGRRAADTRFRPVMVAKHDDRPLSCVEIDNTRLDVFVRIPGEKSKPIRPHLTMAMDVATRSVLAIRISHLAPDENDICRLIIDMLNPKNKDELTKLGVKCDWPMHGMSVKVRVDHGNEFNSEKVKRLLAASGIEQVLCPPKTPRYKGVVERTFRTLNQLGIHQLPGYTRGKPDLKGDARPEKDGLLTLQEVERAVLRLICDVYHTHPHSALDMSPLTAWERACRNTTFRLPPPTSELQLLLHTVEVRKLTRQGIKINGLTYNSYETRGLLDVYGEDQEVDVRWDPSDLGRVFIANPSTKCLVALPCVDRDVTGLDLRSFRFLMRASKSADGKLDEARYLKFRAEFIDYVAKISGSRPNSMMPRGAKRSKRKGPDAARGDTQPLKIGRARRPRQNSIDLVPSSSVCLPPSTKLATSNAQEVQSETDDFEIVTLNKENRHDDR